MNQDTEYTRPKVRLLKVMLTLCLSAALVIGTIPCAPFVTTARAEETEKTIACLGSGVLSVNCADIDAATVYYGKHKEYEESEELAWRVINYDGKGALFNGNENNLTLFASGLIGEMQQFSETSNHYSTSELKIYIDGLYNTDFSETEKSAIQKRNLYSGNYDGINTDCIGGNPLTGDAAPYLWPLSAKEANKIHQKVKDSEDNYLMAAEDWWLRSPDIGTILSGMDFNVNHNMIDYHPGDTAAYVFNENGVRPAFNIGLNPIISTSLIPGTQENPGAEYKLTILDNDLSVSVNEFSKSSDNEITLSYTIADSSTTAEPTQLSALVTDGNTTWTDNHWYDKRGRDYISYLQYTKLDVENFGLSGSGTFILDPLISGTWGEDYHVYILAEDVNGAHETDYASPPVEIGIRPAVMASAEDQVFNYDGKPHGITVTVTYPASGVTVKYGESPDAINSDTCPTITEVSESPKTIYYKAEADGFVPATGSATVTIRNPYDDYPQFEGWGKSYGPYDNAFNAKGQGWLEGGAGVNESVTNVIVPTTPAVNLRYGQPGLFDFGFDPQRLVKKTDAKKYTQENFTYDAIKNGVYFINGPLLFDEKNSYDNKSVKLKATNIGTEPVAFTVNASLAGATDFQYLEEDPVQTVTAADYFINTYEGSLGKKWVAYAESQSMDHTMTDYAEALKSLNLPDYFQTIYTEQELTEVDSVRNQLFEQGGEYPISLYWILRDACDAAGGDRNIFIEYLEKYVMHIAGEVPTDEPAYDTSRAGMFLGLDVAPGTTAFEDKDYEKVTELRETPFRAANAEGKTINAAAGFTQVVKGNKNNYKLKWDEGKKRYVYTIIDNPAPFRTVAFWFRGIATENTSVPADLTVPALEFTWSFSKDNIPEVKALTFNGGSEIPPMLTENNTDYYGKWILTFDHNVESVVYDAYDEQDGWDPDTADWKSLDRDWLTIEGNKLVIGKTYIETRRSWEGKEIICMRVNSEGIGGTGYLMKYIP